ncbi:hypothetical protein D3C84_707900 [compost metagenome]
MPRPVTVPRAGCRTHRQSRTDRCLREAKAVHIALGGLGTFGFEEDGQGFKDGRFAIVIAAYDAGHGFVDGNDGGGAVAAEVGAFDGLEAHGDFPYLQLARKGFLAQRFKYALRQSFFIIPPQHIHALYNFIKLSLLISGRNRDINLQQV